MANQKQNYREWRTQIYECQQVSDIRALLKDLQGVELTKQLDAESIHHLRLDAMEVARQLALEALYDPWNLIEEYLLPYCLEPIYAGDGQSSHLGEQYRDCLTGWIDQYWADDRESLLNNVLDTLVARIASNPTAEACWTVTSIGFRRSDLVAELQVVASNQNDLIGDAALSALIFLALGAEENHKVLLQAHDRATRRFTHSLLSVLRAIGDENSIHVVFKYWLTPGQLELGDFQRSVALRVPVDVADRLSDRSYLQDEVWGKLTELFDSFPELYRSDFYLGRDVISRCDTPDVVSTLLKWISRTATDTERGDRFRYLLALRLQECLRPRQLEGWTTSTDPMLVETLRRDAQKDTGQTIRLPTSESHQKEAAWSILLIMGCAECLDWFEQAVVEEQNSFVRSKIMEMLACFRLEPLPEAVKQWIHEPYDVESKDGSADWAYRTAAIKLARSSPSLESFDALLRFGLTWDGNVLQDSVDAVADVANRLLNDGEATVVESLLDTVAASKQKHHRQAAAHALAHLASLDLLTSGHATRIVPLLGEEWRDPFELSELVKALTFMPSACTDRLTVSHLELWALERNDWLGIRSMEFLARHNYLPNTETLLATVLNLEKHEGSWNLRHQAKLRDWEGFVIGVLYLKNSNEFAPALFSILTDQNWGVAAQALRVIEVALSQGHQVPTIDLVQEALSVRIPNRQTTYSAEIGVLEVAGRLFPSMLATAQWDGGWQHWLPEARITLADMLGKTEFTDDAVLSSAIKKLTKLAQDSHYGVRRSAYRALSRIAHEQLVALCIAWSAEHTPLQLRLRAAEAIAWISTNRTNRADEIGFPALYNRLSQDVERKVRDQAELSKESRRNRAWSLGYLETLRKIEGGTNSEILSAWCYGQALTQLGDDECLWEIRSCLANRNLAFNHALWLRRLEKQLTESWKKATQVWPDPIASWKDTVEVGRGTIQSGPELRVDVKYNVWHKTRASLDEKQSWGGSLSVINERDAWIVLQRFNANSEWSFTMEDGRQADVSLDSISGSFVSFLGLGSYPEAAIAPVLKDGLI